MIKLTRPRSEVEGQLKKLIVRGEEIHTTGGQRSLGYDQLNAESAEWQDRCVLLLTNLFSNPENVRKFKNSFVRRIMYSSDSDFYGDIIENQYRYVNSLKSILNNLDLLEELPTVNLEKKSVTNKTLTKNSEDIFIVHGHDDALKLEVAEFLKKVELNPIILHQQASGNKTIIEKIDAYTNVGFGIVLYTPCDVGKAKSADNLNKLARQNVVFEHGYLMGKLGHSRVFQLTKGDVETPGDLGGIVYTSTASNWQMQLAKELKLAGYDIDMNNAI